MSETVEIRLSDDEFEALKRYRDAEKPEMDRAQVAQYLLRDHLIGLGVLPMGRANRGKRAGR